ncbi:MAG: hypothetical protein KC646_07980 [Candidatus Cloacimonetes bacterium]|nr:hypothetical protein [Candidatus Cloacimonadota bacterium]
MCEDKNNQSQNNDSDTLDDLPKVDDLVSQIVAGWAQPEGTKHKAFDYTVDQQNLLSYLGVLLEDLFCSQFVEGNVQILSYCDLDLDSFIEDDHDSKLSFFAKASNDQFCLISSTKSLLNDVVDSDFKELGIELLSQLNNRIFKDFLVKLKLCDLAPNLSDIQSTDVGQDCILYSLELTHDFKKYPVYVILSRSLVDLLIS